MQDKVGLKVYKIKWDTDGENIDLPKILKLKFSIKELIDEFGKEKVKKEVEKSKKGDNNNLFDIFILDEIENLIDKEYGFCFFGLEYKINYNSFNI